MTVPAHADRIYLRNLKRIDGIEVTQFDEDSVRLSNNTTLTWDEIDQGRLAETKQAAFDKMLAELGTPLYRIRTRLKVGDYEGLLQVAEELYPRYANRRSKTAYLVQQALMWALIDAGRREEAVAPYLACYETLRTSPDVANTLPGERRLRYDAKSGTTPELVPVWFDSEAAKTSLEGVYQTVIAMKQPQPQAIYIYYGTLNLSAGSPDRAKAIFDRADTENAEIAQLVKIAEAQAEVLSGESGEAVKRLEESLDSLVPANKPIALYWLGLAKLQSEDRETEQRGMLQLLRVPAVYGRDYPELAGAAYFHVMQSLSQAENAKGAIAVRKELLERFGHTYFAGRIETRGEGRGASD